MIYFTKTRREALSLLRAVPMTNKELASIMGKHREHVTRLLLDLENKGFVIRYGTVRTEKKTAFLWHWTGKDFGFVTSGPEFDVMQVHALSLPHQMARYEAGVTIALRLDGKDNRHADAA